jgi:hypothetical protein
MNKITNTPSPPAPLQISTNFKPAALARTCKIIAFRNMIEQTLLNGSRESCKILYLYRAGKPLEPFFKVLYNALHYTMDFPFKI